MSPDLALWLTLISWNYPYLEHICMIPEVFESLKFDFIWYSDVPVCGYQRTTGILPQCLLRFACTCTVLPVSYSGGDSRRPATRRFSHRPPFWHHFSSSGHTGCGFPTLLDWRLNWTCTTHRSRSHDPMREGEQSIHSVRRCANSCCCCRCCFTSTVNNYGHVG